MKTKGKQRIKKRPTRYYVYLAQFNIHLSNAMQHHTFALNEIKHAKRILRQILNDKIQ